MPPKKGKKKIKKIVSGEDLGERIGAGLMQKMGFN